MTAAWRRRALSGLGALAVTASSLTLFGAQTAPASAAVDTGSSVTLTKTVKRTHLEPDGTETAVDSRTVTVTVRQTKDLRSRQPVEVSWSGARPTAGTFGDPNSPDARQAEYPFVVMECRGVDSTTVPLAQQLRPETCWTGTTRERDLNDGNFAFPPWRVDRYESAADRKQYVGLPNPLPSCYDQGAVARRALHFVDVKGKDYSNGDASCPDAPPESATSVNSNQPPNTTYANTGLNGKGTTKFTIWTSEDNASLGCGGGVTCSLVAIPIMGISCDAAGKSLPAADQPTGSDLDDAKAACEKNGTYTAGSPPNGGSAAVAVTGRLWFSESNWRNRLSFKLDFAPLNNVCDITGGAGGTDIYGSELLASLTTQWRPAFCLSKTRSPFKHVQVGEPQAANLLKAETVDAAFVSRQPDGGFTGPVAKAPITLTGFSISYVIDDAQRQPYLSLKLNARLLAKLLSQSYPGIVPVQQEYDALSHNPLDMSSDPEFRALNPGIRNGVSDSAAASTLFSLSSDSDVIYALTSYIKADPDAADFLYGVPDPWGMTVNPSYKKISLPVTSWPLLDSFEPKQYYESGQNVCLKNDPTPILPLIANPTARLSNTATAVQFGNSPPQTTCQQIGDQEEGAKLVSAGRQFPGFRFVVAVTSLGDAARYDLSSADLQTYVAPGTPEKFTDAKGRSFASATDDGLRAAASLFRPDSTSGAWAYDYALNLTAAGAKAYPGSMLVYLDAPTTGLPKAQAVGLSQLLTFAAGSGQVRGYGVGQLPPGYLPLTAANNLSSQLARTKQSALDVAAQNSGTTGVVAPSPPPVPLAPPPTTGGTSGTPVVPGVVTPGQLPTPAGSDPTVAQPDGITPVASSLGTTKGVAAGFASSIVPLLASLGLAGAIGCALLMTLGRPKAAV